jgi:hypothetical protein
MANRQFWLQFPETIGPVQDTIRTLILVGHVVRAR